MDADGAAEISDRSPSDLRGNLHSFSPSTVWIVAPAILLAALMSQHSRPHCVASAAIDAEAQTPLLEQEHHGAERKSNCRGFVGFRWRRGPDAVSAH